jgi:hypothetical protein
LKALKSRLRHWPVVATVNAAIKARSMERDVVLTQRSYGNQLLRRGLSVARGPDLQTALRQRLGDRSRRLGWPKPCGDLHIFLMFPLHNWEAVLPGALSAFGRVTSFEWRSLGFDETASDWVLRREEMNRALLARYRAAAAERPVDVVVGYVSGATVAPEVLEAMAADGAVVANFCFDDKVYWPGQLLGNRCTSPAAIAHAVDLNLTCDPQGMLRYAVHGGLAMFHPEAADPDLHCPLPVEFEYDVSFIGARYGWRPTFIRQLGHRGIEVTCFGKGWPNASVSNEDMKQVYARSRINLGFGGIGHSRSLVCLKGRDFEVPMSGALYLTQHNPELALVFELGQEVVTYRDEDDCARIIRELLADPERAAKIRRAARARCLSDHTYFARWSHVFRTLGAMP